MVLDAQAARQLGFPASRIHTIASLDDLIPLLETKLFPIVYVDLWPIKGDPSGQHYSLIVIAVESERVTVMNPMIGETTLSRLEFQTIWREMNDLSLVIAT
jgi:predicted double-glycine peptidase